MDMSGFNTFLTALTLFLYVMVSGIRWHWMPLHQGHGATIWQEIGDPLLCFMCVYLGVMSTTLLASSSVLSMTDVSYAVIPALTPLGSVPIAARVFDVRAHARWRSSQRTRLGARLLYAYSDGVMWWRWLRMQGK
jgi:hypothetical protein